MDSRTGLLLEAPIGRAIVRLVMPNEFFGVGGLIIFGGTSAALAFFEGWFAGRREPLPAVPRRNEI
jgi:hypothetical protein